MYFRGRNYGTIRGWHEGGRDLYWSFVTLEHEPPEGRGPAGLVPCRCPRMRYRPLVNKDLMCAE